MPKTKKTKLKLQQELFADWYIKLGHITQAAKNAGYSNKTAYSIGSRLLKKVEIQEYIKLRKTQLEELLGFNKATVIKDLLDIKDKSMQAVPVMFYNPKAKQYEQKTEENEEGESVGVYQYDSLGAIKALENIGKMMDYFAPTKTEDTTPLENKAPVIVVNKTYVNKEPDQPTPKAD